MVDLVQILNQSLISRNKEGNKEENKSQTNIKERLSSTTVSNRKIFFGHKATYVGRKSLKCNTKAQKKSRGTTKVQNEKSFWI